MADEIIREALDEGITNPDVIYSRIRNALPFMAAKEIGAALSVAGVPFDGLVDPRLSQIGDNRRTCGFTRF